ncbi:transposase [uncultured Megasphaera sp.]|uniref:transposase n=1 Tax=uncultured Megasphaera sp. TaxID=165188 RepID=UPI0025D68412|nr:transposase [uncultured Megasphaera sp.]
MLSKRKNIRLPHYDYSQNGMYFVTICTKGKRHLFGDICNSKMQLNLLGKLIQAQLLAIPNQYIDTKIIYSIIMPNHVHFIVSIETGNHAVRLGRIVNKFKGLSTRKAGIPLWQRGYFEHVVRTEAELLAIMKYIENNPARWELRQQNFHI